MTDADRPRRIWVTRTRPAADATAERLTRLGLVPIVAPVLAMRPIAVAAPDLNGVDGLAFTSGHAVATFAALSPQRSVQVFTVGEATAEAARRAGFSRVVSAEGDVGALADRIADAKPSLVLNPTAAEPAANLIELLTRRGVPAAALIVYETVPTGAFAPLGEIDAILVHSARAAGLIAGHLAGQADAARLRAYAISAAAAAPLRSAGLESIQVAAEPTESALLALLA